MDRLRALFLLVLCVLAGCSTVPEPGSPEYLEAVGAFHGGVAAMQVGEDLRARARLELVTELVPEEPAAWANLGILALRRGENPEGLLAAEKAFELAPGDAAIARVAARARLASGDQMGAMAALDPPGDVRSAWLLAEIREQAGEPALALAGIGEADRLAPDNLAVAVFRARMQAQRGEGDALREWASSLESHVTDHPDPDVLADAVARLANSSDQELVVNVARLGNVLARSEEYRRQRDAASAPMELVEYPINQTRALAAVPSRPAAPDLSLRLEPNPIPAEGGPWASAVVALLGDDPFPAVLLVTREQVHLPDGSTVSLPDGALTDGIRSFDLDQDFLQDLIVPGTEGLHVLFQRENGGFADPVLVHGGPATAVWVADVDSEGDLDLLAAAEDGLSVLTNDGDGSFQAGFRFPLDAPIDLAWGDLDGDGDPDGAVVDAHQRLHLLENQRNGRWEPPRLLLEGVAAVGLADLDADAVLDIAVAGADGRLWLVGPRRTEELGRTVKVNEPRRLFLEDLDNNGALDWVVSAAHTEVLLANPDGTLVSTSTVDGFRTLAAAVLDEEGAPELVGIGADGVPVVLFAAGDLAYHWKRVWPRAAVTEGDRRINTFAVGGEVELRSGLLYQKRAISGNAIHLGLGDNPLSEVLRIVWPNGDVQVEFDLLSDESVLAQQRLKGSCPWIFTHNGDSLRFITDFLWRSPLGLRINAQETAGIATTEDRVRIPGDALRAVDGVYEVRITAELWETHFFDHVSLRAVDHPAGVSMLLDERFAFPPPTLNEQFLGVQSDFAEVRDGNGTDWTQEAREADGVHIGGFAKGPYQGVATEHSIEMTLPGSAGPEPHLVGYGWVRPTDSSINVALGQSAARPPSALRLEIPGPNGSWQVALDNLGFPSGKNKTVVIDLSGLWPEGMERRFRLVTNLEVYWDRLAWAEPVPTEPRVAHLPTSTATLRYRGFSRVTTADDSSPEIPSYQQLAGTHPVWQDLEGYHTRFGDVRELLGGVDDRYVIMNAGDELVLRFEAPPDPPAGWERSFVLVGDGWVKDGDLNTTFSHSVLPLPQHGQAAYDRPPSGLEDDPVYRDHAGDWDRFHTRYVTSGRFRSALRPR